MSKIDWSKAPEWATHATPKGHNYYAAFWRIVQGTATDAWVVLPDGDFDHVLLPALFERDRKELVERPSSPAWDGEGLPPVGTVCEAAIPHTSGPDNERSFIWIEGHVIAYHELNGETYAWFAEDDGFYPPNVLDFRPIRTPEQIAAEEREKAIDEMHVMIDSDRAKHFRLLCEALYDAGYRKTEGAQ